jgi:hypothetical protein
MHCNGVVLTMSGFPADCLFVRDCSRIKNACMWAAVIVYGNVATEERAAVLRQRRGRVAVPSVSRVRNR